MTRPYKLEIVANRIDVCRLRIKAPNGEIVFSGEQYFSASNARRAAEKFRKAALTEFQIVETFEGPPAAMPTKDE